MGMDVTSLMSVPLFIMEPFSMLQKMAEIMEYTQLLDQANAAEDPYERCVQHPHSQQLAVAMQNLCAAHSLHRGRSTPSFAHAPDLHCLWGCCSVAQPLHPWDPAFTCFGRDSMLSYVLWDVGTENCLCLSVLLS